MTTRYQEREARLGHVGAHRTDDLEAWIAEHADIHGIAIAPHGTANGILGLAALIQVCAVMPDNLIAFEYPARFEPFWYDITEGFDGMPVKGGLIDVPDRPGLGVNLVAKEAKKHLSEGDADFFD